MHGRRAERRRDGRPFLFVRAHTGGVSHEGSEVRHGHHRVPRHHRDGPTRVGPIDGSHPGQHHRCARRGRAGRDDHGPECRDRCRAIDGERRVRRLPGAVARARPLPGRGAPVGLQRSVARRRCGSRPDLRREHPVDGRGRGRGRERHGLGAGDRDGHDVGRSGHQPAHGAGDSAERPALRRSRPAHSRARSRRRRTAF